MGFSEEAISNATKLKEELRCIAREKSNSGNLVRVNIDQ